MSGLAPRVDQAVRSAVDAFIEGRFCPEYAGALVFETKHSSYRLLDGILSAAPDGSLLGAELVGWLIEGAKRSSVESAWQATARAVLVDRKRGRHIIVTSSTRRLHRERDEAYGSSADQDGSPVHPPTLVESESVAPPRPALPLPSPPPLRARIPACPPLPGLSARPAPTSRPRVHAPPRPMQPRIPQATAPRPFTAPLPYPAAPPRRAGA